MIIAIDGPAGAGKSTVARRVADELGFRYLDTGALYRVVALRHIQTKRPPEEIAAELHVDLGDRVVVDDEDVTIAIRSAEVTNMTPRLAKRREVRAALLLKQRELLHQGDWVADGRDVGSVVAPDAEVKVFLDATPEERARRRAEETGEVLVAVLMEIKQRDEHDANRPESPLVCVDDACIIDSTQKSPDEVVAEVIALAQEHPAFTGTRA